MRIKAFGMSDIGMKRKKNQDYFLIDNTLGIYVVADGMGGMEAGEKASKFVANAMKIFLQEKLDDPRATSDVRYMIRSIRSTVNEVNKQLRMIIGTKTGSTLLLLIYNGNKLYITNLGDSLAFGIRDNQFIQFTPEHNMAWLLVMMNRISAEDVKDHPAKHRLTAYMGMEGEISVYVNVIKPKINDRILLCTDGLTGMVSEKLIQKTLKEEKEIEQAVNKLIQSANENGGDDNITSILIEFCEDD